MQSKSPIDQWFPRDNKQRMATYERLKTLLEEEEQEMTALVDHEKHWEAFQRLNLLLLYCSDQIEPGEGGGHKAHRAPTLYALVEWWTADKKELIDEIVRGIGADGYGLSTSIYGMNLSVSFSTGASSSLDNRLGAETSAGPPVGSETSGMTRALGHHTRAPTPNDNRSVTMNPNNPAFRAAADNRSNQMNPNNPAYRSPRGGSKGKR